MNVRYIHGTMQVVRLFVKQMSLDGSQQKNDIARIAFVNNNSSGKWMRKYNSKLSRLKPTASSESCLSEYFLLICFCVGVIIYIFVNF